MTLLRARIRSFGYALAGLRFVIRTQHNAWLHLIAAGVAICGGLVLGISAMGWLWIASAIALVWFAEAMNTAFEHLCDVVSPDHSESVKHAKDIAAGAVLITAIYAVIVAIVVFSGKI